MLPFACLGLLLYRYRDSKLLLVAIPICTLTDIAIRLFDIKDFLNINIEYATADYLLEQVVVFEILIYMNRFNLPHKISRVISEVVSVTLWIYCNQMLIGHYTSHPLSSIILIINLV